MGRNVELKLQLDFCSLGYILQRHLCHFLNNACHVALRSTVFEAVFTLAMIVPSATLWCIDLLHYVGEDYSSVSNVLHPLRMDADFYCSLTSWQLNLRCYPRRVILLTSGVRHLLNHGTRDCGGNAIMLLLVTQCLQPQSSISYESI